MRIDVDFVGAADGLDCYHRLVVERRVNSGLATATEVFAHGELAVGDLLDGDLRGGGGGWDACQGLME